MIAEKFAQISGMDSKHHHAVGGPSDSFAIWLTVGACICSRQALALSFPALVCLENPSICVHFLVGTSYLATPFNFPYI